MTASCYLADAKASGEQLDFEPVDGNILRINSLMIV